MFVVLDEDAERCLFRLAEANSEATPSLLSQISASFSADEDRVVIACKGGRSLSQSSGESLPLPCYISSGAIPLSPGEHVHFGSFPALLLSVPSGVGSALQAHFHSSVSASPELCQIEVIRLESDLFSRVKGIFDTRILAPKTVSVIGVGSGGSLGALELAKSGVGNFILVDFDRLKAHNIVRHVCGIADVGRFKTRAVRDAMLAHNPQASVVCHEVDITDEPELLDLIVNASDLVFVATDNQPSRYLINEACLSAGKPAVYGGAYERAFAGEVIRVIPGEAGCYACVRQGLAPTMRSIASHQDLDYTDDEDFEAEPGLGLDVAFIGLIHAKLALLTLLRDTSSTPDPASTRDPSSTIKDLDTQMIIWVNSARPQDGELFARPMARHFVKVAKVRDCPSCGAGFDDIPVQDEFPQEHGGQP